MASMAYLADYTTAADYPQYATSNGRYAPPPTRWCQRVQAYPAAGCAVGPQNNNTPYVGQSSIDGGIFGSAPVNNARHNPTRFDPNRSTVAPASAGGVFAGGAYAAQAAGEDPFLARLAVAERSDEQADSLACAAGQRPRCKENPDRYMLVSPADGVTVGEDGVMPWQLEKQSRSPPKDNGNNSGLLPVRMEPVQRAEDAAAKVVAAQQLRRQREIRMREEQQQRQQQPPGRRVQWQPEQQQQQFPPQPTRQQFPPRSRQDQTEWMEMVDCLATSASSMHTQQQQPMAAAQHPFQPPPYATQQQLHGQHQWECPNVRNDCNASTVSFCDGQSYGRRGGGGGGYGGPRPNPKMIGGKLVRSGQNNYATLEQPAGGSANSTIPETGWVNGRVVIGAKGRGRAGSANDAQRSSLGSLMQHNAGR